RAGGVAVLAALAFFLAVFARVRGRGARRMPEQHERSAPARAQHQDGRQHDEKDERLAREFLLFALAFAGFAAFAGLAVGGRGGFAIGLAFGLRRLALLGLLFLFRFFLLRHGGIGAPFGPFR